MPKPLSSSQQSSFSVPSHVRAKSLGISHTGNVRQPAEQTTAARRQLSRNDSPPSTRLRAATFLLQVRDAGEWSQEQAAAVAGAHRVTIGERERADVELGALEQAVAMLGELSRQRGPDAVTDALLKLGASIERAAALKKTKEGK